MTKPTSILAFFGALQSRFMNALIWASSSWIRASDRRLQMRPLKATDNFDLGGQAAFRPKTKNVKVDKAE